MSANQKQQAPARRTTLTSTPEQPKIYHHIHHRDPNGTVHTLCGKQLPPSTTTKAALKSCTILCVLCDAAHIIMDARL